MRAVSGRALMGAGAVRRQLGLARSSARTRSSTRAARQRFGYLIVIDFEATCWRDAGRRAPEIGECRRGGAWGAADTGGRSERSLARLTGQPPITSGVTAVNGSNLPGFGVGWFASLLPCFPPSALSQSNFQQSC